MSEVESKGMAGLAGAAAAVGVAAAAVMATQRQAAPAAAPSASEASRFLHQASFGPTDDDIAAVQSLGFDGWLQAQQATPPSGSHLAFIDMRLAQLREQNRPLNALEFTGSFWQQAATGADQLRQRVKLALSEIFVVSFAGGMQDVRGVAAYYDMLGAHAFGNYRALLEQVARHPQMGVYLSHLGNLPADAATGRHPDENFAREIMQLFSIGLFKLNPDGTPQLDARGERIPTYSAADIQGLARVFTGFSWYSTNPNRTTFVGGQRHPDVMIRPMIGYPQFHEAGAKSFLGVTIPASATPDPDGDLRIALDALFYHPNTAPFISRQLIQRLVTSNPSPGYVGRVAAVFGDNGSGVRGDLAAVVRAILLDDEARDPAAGDNPAFGKVREPIVRIGNWARTFRATSQSGAWITYSMAAPQALGQAAMNSPSVFNFFRPGYTPPNTQIAAAGLVAPELQIVDEVSIAGYLNTLLSILDRGLGAAPSPGGRADIQASYSAEIAAADDPEGLVERMNLLLLYGRMSAGLRARIVESVAAIPLPGPSAPAEQRNAVRLNRVRAAIFMAMASSEYLVQR